MMSIINKFNELVRFGLHAAGGAFVIRFVAAIVHLLLILLITRSMSLGDAGLYFVVINLLLAASVIVRLGFDYSLVRYLSPLWREMHYSAFITLYLKAVLIVAALSSIASVCLYMIFWDRVDSMLIHSPKNIDISVVSVALVPFALMKVQAAVYKSCFMPTLSALFDVLFVPACMLIFMYSFDATKIEEVVYLYVIAVFLSFVTSLIILIYFVFVKTSGVRLKGVGIEGAGNLYGEFSSTSFSLFVTSILNYILAHSGVLLLGYFDEAEGAAYYSVVTRMAALMSFLLVVFNGVFASHYAALYKQGDIGALGKLSAKIGALLFASVIPIVFVYIFFAEEILALFGEGYESAATAFRIVVVGQFVNVVVGSVAYLLMMSDNESVLLKVTIANVILTFILNYILTMNYGYTGSSMALSLSMVCSNLVNFYLVVRYVKINTLAYMVYFLPRSWRK